LSDYLTGIAIKQANDIFPSALIRLVDFRQHAFDITGGIIFEITRLTIKGPLYNEVEQLIKK